MDATPREGTESRLDRLITLRSTLEATFAEGVPAREFAALSREYRATLAEIDELTPKKPEGDVVDQIAERRAARRAGGAKPPSRAKRTS